MGLMARGHCSWHPVLPCSLWALSCKCNVLPAPLSRGAGCRSLGKTCVMPMYLMEAFGRSLCTNTCTNTANRARSVLENSTSAALVQCVAQ